MPDKFEIAPVAKGAGGIFPTVFGVLREQRPHAAATIAFVLGLKAPDPVVSPGPD